MVSPSPGVATVEAILRHLLELDAAPIDLLLTDNARRGMRLQ